MEQVEYKVLKVDTTTSTGVRRMAAFLKFLAILAFITGFILFVIWLLKTYKSEDYLMPFVSFIGLGVTLLVMQSALKALSKIAEASEYTKAKISEGYEKIEEQVEL